MHTENIISTAKFYMPFFCGVAISIFLGISSHIIFYKIIAKRYPDPTNAVNIFFSYLKGPLFIIFPLLYITLVSSILDFGETAYVISLIVKVSLIISVSWSALKLIDYSDIWLARRYQANGQSLTHAEVRTRIYLLRKIAKIFIFIIAISLILLSFDSVREIGKGMILSAGVLGAIVALGAQKLFGNIISGFQLAFTKPIQIGDMIKVGEELGSIEEITLTYIIIRTWDLRKLVIPLSQLMEKPFENWSQLKEGLLGTVFFYTDYSIEVGKLKEALAHILQTTPLWNKKVGKLEVTNLTDKSMELRALLSAQDSGMLWDLRCYVREKLMEFIAKEYPQSLPKIFYANISDDEKK
jgi:small-conductance mechanosensitive channel